nr:hypothetical protein [Morchella crassipes]
MYGYEVTGLRSRKIWVASLGGKVGGMQLPSLGIASLFHRTTGPHQHSILLCWWDLVVGEEGGERGAALWRIDEPYPSFWICCCQCRVGLYYLNPMLYTN